MGQPPNIKKWDKTLKEIELIDPYDDSGDDYEVQEKVPWGYLVANQLLNINRIVSTDARTNPSRFRDAVDILYTYVLSDADNDQIFQKSMNELIAWKKGQLIGLPPQQRQHKQFILEFEYAFKKLRLIMKLMDKKGYFGSKVLR